MSDDISYLESDSESGSESNSGLGSIICDSWETSQYYNGAEKHYLPRGVLKKLLTHETVYTEMNVERTPRNELLVDFIVNRANKVFALTCSIINGKDLYRAMKAFHAKGCDDESLPVERKMPIDGEGHKSTSADRRFEVFKSEAFKPKLWTSLRLFDFYQKQWQFLAPAFDDKTFIYELDERLILPFKLVKSEAKQGTFGEIYQVEIHREHLSDFLFQKNGRRTNVAVKEIKTGPSMQDDAAEAFNIEAHALSKCRHVKHSNMLPCIAAIKMGLSHYFLFPWADGGNLRDFWKSEASPKLSSNLMMDALQQLCGLSKALELLHGYTSQAHADPSTTREEGGGIRHGDLKPENILRFRSSTPSDLGTLKIADMGLAKHHEVSTKLRQNMTSTKYGTLRYEPPETAVNKTQATSRLYDVWSMGCIILEFVVWLLDGQNGLDNFNDSIRGVIKHDYDPPYYITRGAADQMVALVHPVVMQQLDDLSRRTEAQANRSALGDLVTIVKERLLIVDLPSEDRNTPEPSENNQGPKITHTRSPSDEESGIPRRVTAGCLRQSLTQILDRADNDPKYLFSRHILQPRPLTPIPFRTDSSGSLHPDMAKRMVQKETPATRLAITQMKGNVIWDFIVDNEFAKNFLGSSSTRPTPTVANGNKSDTLCRKCAALDFWALDFRVRDRLSDLKSVIQHCRWCTMRWEASKHLEGKTESVVFSRAGSVIKLNESDPPVFSLFKPQGFETPSPLQIGRPRLRTSPREADHFRLIKRWLQVCDDDHDACRRDSRAKETTPPHISAYKMDSVESVVSRDLKNRKVTQLPTRLLDVGIEDSPKLRLCNTQSENIPVEVEYIALSHPWGEATVSNPHFCTTKSSVVAHSNEIKFEALPNTFKDAVYTTRALGVQYLWIDSLCIIQGPDGDFNTESSRMEQVFSSAYCVIAASRASGQCDGFLKDRIQSSENDYVTFPHENNSPFYVSRYLDDFNNDVLEGSMNKRGWVLQERALARRTIYFTDKQTYFECGDGVRCETLTKMNNQLAALLGDPNFPQKAIVSTVALQETTRGQRILYYQDLYKTYSKLGFSHWEDRSVAMNGLEQRLAWGFKCRGKFGILGDSIQADHKSLLHRSLLWIRAINKDSLRKIKFPPHREKVPTWSWMAFQGEIDYLSVPFGQVNWDTELKSPWQAMETKSTGRSGPPSIRARAYQLSVRETSSDVNLVFNSRGQLQPPISNALCVVVGRARGLVPEESRIHYVLLIRPSDSMCSSMSVETYERVGAGSLPREFIDFHHPGYDVAIF
ncbi:serine/threonine protein kinase [Fusarium oxysporum NRRL 32931]|uniref:Serine/threonine protein kinase n=1 Tax=Fusarium oxysporum NRRL 32931 TaxID=660029 RepID=W9IBA6_FUSOX|nr:serine/threonine protein kinase [Fusarium oxysporum NRRL 32931]